MDDQLSIGELKDKVQAFCEARNWDQFHQAKDLAIGIITEASELLEKFRFKSQEEAEQAVLDKESRQELSHEVADVFFFILRFCQRNSIDLSRALLEKLQLNEKRYPIEKSKGLNKKYTEL